jgi:hypothetical protein
LESPETTASCRKYSEAIRSVDAIALTCDLLEGLREGRH